MVSSFEEFLNEELNIQRYDNGICRFEDRWFFYAPDDEIVYGCDVRPDDVADGFAFNPVECVVVKDDGDIRYEKKTWCLISYNMDTNEVDVLNGESLSAWMDERGLTGMGVTHRPDDAVLDEIESIFEGEHEQGVKNLLIWGDQLLASTFDVIEEN